MRILVTDGMDKSAQEKLREMGHEVVGQFYEPDELGKALQDFDAVVVRSKTKVRQNHIDEALQGKLKLIIRGGVGVDNIDVAYAKEKGIEVRNTPKKAYGKGTEVCGKTVGIIGYGRIGHCLGHMCKALGMDVMAYGAHHEPGTVADDGTPYVSLDELFAKSDFISLHAPKADGPIVTAENIEKMKDGVIIINTSRGANIDDDALLAALDSGKVRAAGLDVYPVEPAENAALYAHPAVSCTPHIGASTKEAQKRIGEEIVSIIKEFNA